MHEYWKILEIAFFVKLQKHENEISFWQTASKTPSNIFYKTLKFKQEAAIMMLL